MGKIRLLDILSHCIATHLAYPSFIWHVFILNIEANKQVTLQVRDMVISEAFVKCSTLYAKVLMIC